MSTPHTTPKSAYPTNAQTYHRTLSSALDHAYTLHLATFNPVYIIETYHYDRHSYWTTTTPPANCPNEHWYKYTPPRNYPHNQHPTPNHTGVHTMPQAPQDTSLVAQRPNYTATTRQAFNAHIRQHSSRTTCQDTSRSLAYWHYNANNELIGYAYVLSNPPISAYYIITPTP